VKTWICTYREADPYEPFVLVVKVKASDEDCACYAAAKLNWWHPLLGDPRKWQARPVSR